MPGEELNQAAFARLRALIEDVAQEWQASHRLTETVKWGQPSFALTPKAGTAVRMGLNGQGEVALFVHCGTTVISDWREACALTETPVRTEGNRALIVDPDRIEDARGFIRRALTYRRV